MRLALAALLALLAVVPARADDVEARMVATGERVAGFDGLVAALADADIVVIGEIHDNPRHQALAARLVRALEPVGVALEMLKTPDEAAARAALAAGEPVGIEGLAPYAGIMEAAPGGRVFGAGVPRDRIMGAMGGTAAEAFDGDAARFGLAAPLPAAVQAEMEEELFLSHCEALPQEMLPGMVEAQRLRDAAFAAAALRAREAGGQSVLIAGNGHARTDRGVPAVLAVAAPELDVVAVAQVERGTAEAWGAPPPFDILVVTDSAERGDPCAQFRKGG